MDPQIQKELLARLDILASKLGVASQFIWGVLVRQAVLEGIVKLIFGVLFSCLAVLSIKKFNDSSKIKYNDAWLTFYGFVSALMTVIGSVMVYHGLIEALNPSYKALSLLREAL